MKFEDLMVHLKNECLEVYISCDECLVEFKRKDM